MGKITGFLEFEREDRDYEPVEERVEHWREFVLPLSEEENKKQAARCMDCGIPYCHTGCPVNNQIPDWNDLVYRGDWEEAARNLHSTNNFPEVTGRVCPAPCEASCTLNIDDNPVTIKTIECAIADRAFEQRLGQAGAAGGEDRQEGRDRRLRSGRPGLRAATRPRRPRRPCVREVRQGRRAAALRHPRLQDGEAHRRPAGRADGSRRRHLPLRRPCRRRTCRPTSSLADHDAVVLAGGAEKPRDLPIPGRELEGIHFAMDFLPQQNRRVSGEPPDGSEPILAGGKHVVVIGGGDTGSDCIGTSIRQGARSVTNFEIMPQPPEKENKLLTWPDWPLKLRTSSSHEEGAERDFAVMTTKFLGDNGRVQKLHCVRVDDKFKPIAGSEFELDADLVLLAMGFVHPGARGHDRVARARARPARQRQGRHPGLSQLEPEGVRGRRHAARPVAGGVGDPRGPPVRARGRQVPDGIDGPAAVSTFQMTRHSRGRLVPAIENVDARDKRGHDGR